MNDEALSGALAGLCVLVTRPEPQAQRLAERLQAHGAVALTAPLLTLRALPAPPSLHGDYDALVVTSVPAAQHYALAMTGRVLPLALPVFAVGEATAEAMRALGFEQVTTPPRDAETSEGLLALPALRARLGERLLLLRGRGGRDALAQAASAAGGALAVAELYERVLPARDWPAEVTRWRAAELAAVLVTSGETLDNLVLVTPVVWRDWLCQRLLVVPSARVAEQAGERGFVHVVDANGASDEAMAAALMAAVPMNQKDGA